MASSVTSTTSLTPWASSSSSAGAGGNLGAPPKPAVAHVGHHPQPADRGADDLRAERLGGRLDAADRPELLADTRGRGADPLPLRAPRLDHRLQHHAKARHPLARLGGEVGAAVERDALGIEEGGQRPAAVPRHPLHRLHVDRVEVGALLAIDLDADEVLVHVCGRLGVLERLALHHVAPVASRIADRQQDRLVLRLGPLQGLVLPRRTTRPGCPCAAGGRGSSARRGGWPSCPRLASRVGRPGSPRPPCCLRALRGAKAGRCSSRPASRRASWHRRAPPWPARGLAAGSSFDRARPRCRAIPRSTVDRGRPAGEPRRPGAPARRPRRLPLGASRMIPYSPRPTGASLSDSRSEVRNTLAVPRRSSSAAGSPYSIRISAMPITLATATQGLLGTSTASRRPPQLTLETGRNRSAGLRQGTYPRQRQRRAAARGRQWRAASWDPSLPLSAPLRHRIGARAPSPALRC